MPSKRPSAFEFIRGPVQAGIALAYALLMARVPARSAPAAPPPSPYRSAVTFENKTAVVEPEMPVAIRLDTLRLIGLNKLRPDVADLVLSDPAGNAVPFVAEGIHDDTEPARIWIRLPEIAPGAKLTYSVTYGSGNKVSDTNAYQAVFPDDAPADQGSLVDLHFNGDLSALLVQGLTPGIIPPLPAPGYHGTGAWFNGQNSGADVLIPHPADLNSGFTLEFWVKPVAYENLWDHQYLASIDGRFVIERINGSVTTSISLPHGAASVTAPDKLTNFEWHHVAVTYDGQNLSLFQDGVLSAQQPMKEPPNFTGGHLYLGFDPITGGRFWTPMIADDVAIFARALTSFPGAHPPPTITPGAEETIPGAAPASLAPAASTVPAPVMIPVEAEDFDGVVHDQDFYESIQIMGKPHWFPAYTRPYLSRQRGIYTFTEGASASTTVDVPREADYLLWVRYAPVGEQEFSQGIASGSEFQVSVEQGTHAAGSHEFGSVAKLDQRQARWEGMTVHLTKGPATIRLLKNIPHPNQGEKIDMMLLTTDTQYVPDMRDFSSVWIRIHALELQPDEKYRIRTDVLRHTGPNWYQMFWQQDAAYFLSQGVTSEWLNLTPYVKDSAYDCTVTFSLVDEKNQPDQSGKLSVEFARRPMDSAIYKTVTMQSTRQFGITVPGTIQSLKEFETSSDSVDIRAHEHLEEALAQKWPKPNVPKQIQIQASAGVGSYSDDVVRSELQTLHEMGINLASASYDGFGGKDQTDIAKRIGFDQTDAPFYLYIGPALYKESPYTDAFWKIIEDNFTARVKAIRDRSGDEELNMIRWVPLNDEVSNWLAPDQFFANHDNLAAFGRWLDANGTKPGFLGAASWAELKPVTVRSAATSAEQKRLWWLEQQFLSYTTAKIYRRATDMWQKELGRKLLTTINPSPHIYMGNGFTGEEGGLDPFAFWGQSGTTCAWSEDWSSSVGWLFISCEEVSYIADLLRCAAAPAGLGTGMYITPGEAVAQRLKIFSALGHGERAINYYTYGPAYSMTEGMWSEDASEFDELGRIDHEITEAEDLLAPAKPRHAQVALLYSYSGDVWMHDPAVPAERFYLYLALQHAQIPVDIVSEQQIAAGDLAGYKTLYVADENVTHAAQAQIASWVRGGGSLVAILGAGSRDENDAPSAIFDHLLGLAHRETVVDSDSVKAGFHRYGINSIKQLGTVRFTTPLPPLAMGVFGVQSGNIHPTTAKVVGTYAGGAPAATLNVVGKGRGYFLGAAPGLSYARGANVQAGKYTTDYPADVRRLIITPAQIAGVQQDVESSAPIVEATLQESAAGAVVTLANYTMKLIGDLKLSIRVNRPVRRVVSVLRGPVPFTVAGERVHVSLPLDSTDFLKLYY